jgi:hypothetical protein
MPPLRSQAFHKQWLLVSALVVVSFGPVFAFGSLAATSEPARWTLDLLHWPLDGEQRYADETVRFLSALTGGFLTGWGVLIWCLRRWVYDTAPDGVRRSVLVGMLAWFVVDSVASIAAGAQSNALFNVLVLLSAVGPLWRRASASDDYRTAAGVVKSSPGLMN